LYIYKLQRQAIMAHVEQRHQTLQLNNRYSPLAITISAIAADAPL